MHLRKREGKNSLPLPKKHPVFTAVMNSKNINVLTRRYKINFHRYFTRRLHNIILILSYRKRFGLRGIQIPTYLYSVNINYYHDKPRAYIMLLFSWILVQLTRNTRTYNNFNSGNQCIYILFYPRSSILVGCTYGFRAE